MRNIIPLKLSILFILIVLTSSCKQSKRIEINKRESPKLSLVLIQHDSCPFSYFWCVLEKGVIDAQKKLSIDVEIKSPNHSLDPKNQFFDKLVILNDAINNKSVGGIGLTLNNIENLEIEYSLENGEKISLIKLLERAKKQKKPIIVYNAFDVTKDIKKCHNINSSVCSDLNSSTCYSHSNYQGPSLMLPYIGPNDCEGGLALGKKIAEFKKFSNVLCFNHSYQSEHLFQRCNNFESGLKKQNNGIKYKYEETKQKVIDAKRHKNITGINQIIINSRLNDLLNKNSYDFILTLGPVSANAYYKYLSDNPEAKKIKHATYDLSKLNIEKIESKQTLYVVDQQPYSQGFLTVQWLTWILRYNFNPPTKFYTGPNFICKQEYIDSSFNIKNGKGRKINECSDIRLKQIGKYR